MNRKLLDALKGLNISSTPPIWIMRQAGRYLPEYRALREAYSFLEICHNPELIVKTTLMPLKRFDFDAAIVFSDILLILESLGKRVEFKDQEGPVITDPLSSPQGLNSLIQGRNKEKMSFVQEGITLLKKELTCPLLGFAGAPFTVASYLIEGKSNSNLTKTKLWIWQDPDSFSQLLELLTQETISYLNLQIQAGVDAIQLFDTWAGFLPFQDFHKFVMPCFQKIIEALRPTNIPVILFMKNSSFWAKDLSTLRPDGISVDWPGQLSRVRRQVGSRIALQGNLDPEVLFAPLSVIEERTKSILDDMDNDPGFIFNLGHGILPQTPLESVEKLIDIVKSRIFA